MIMKTISMMPESQRRSMMVRLDKLIKEGRSVSEISSELHIPESEIHDCIEWVKNVKNKSKNV